MNLGELAYPDVPEDAVHLLPLGATEPHGPHAPLVDRHADLGRDLRARGGAARGRDPRARPARAAVRRDALRLGVRGTVSISEETLRSLVAEIAASVGTLVLVNSHFEPEQVETLRATGLPLLDLTRRANAERLTEEFRSGSCHAGRYETSLVLADRPSSSTPTGCATLEERHVDMPAAIRDGRTDFLAMGMDEAYCGAPAESSAEEGARDVRDAGRDARRADPRGRRVITNADLPRELNLASWFVDRNVEEGRGDRTALHQRGGHDDLRGARAARQPLRQPAPRARRAGPGSSPARPRRLGRLRRALVRRAEDRRGHRRGVHVPPAEGLRVLPRVHRRSGRGRGRDDAGRDPPGRRRAAGPGRRRQFRARLEQLSGRARAGADDEGRRLRSGSSRPAAPAGRRAPSIPCTARSSATSGTRAACSGSARTTSCCPCRSSSSATRAT